MTWHPVSSAPKLRLQEYGRLSSGDVLVCCKDGRQRVATLECYEDEESSRAWYSACSERWDITAQVLFWRPLPKSPLAPKKALRLKVLRLDSWMESEWLREDCLSDGRYASVPVRFGRPGIYLLGSQCWFELPDGRAFSYAAADFRYRLSLLDAEGLSAEQAAALAALVKVKLATKAQRAKLHAYQDACMCRETYRNSRKHAFAGFEG